MMPDKMIVPRRRVKKDWYVGLSPDHANHTQNDVHDDSLMGDEFIETEKPGTSFCNHTTSPCSLSLSSETVPVQEQIVTNCTDRAILA
jgi:hypothetical protein